MVLLDAQEGVIALTANCGANLTHVSEPTVLRVMEQAAQAECDTWQLGGRDGRRKTAEVLTQSCVDILDPSKSSGND